MPGYKPNIFNMSCSSCYVRMGSWIAKLAGHKKDTAESLKDPHAIAAYTLFFGCVAFVLLLWIVIAILATIRIYKKYSRRSEDGDTKVTVYDIKIT